jgi:hypothetical protein
MKAGEAASRMLVEGKRIKHLILAILSGVLLIVGWIVISHSGKTVSALASGERGSIALQSPRVVLGQGGGEKGMQTTVANCAKGFVRRDSICVRDAATQMGSSVASNSAGQSSVRPPERQ